jgi:hypothetical protein
MKRRSDYGSEEKKKAAAETIFSHCLELFIGIGADTGGFR